MIYNGNLGYPRIGKKRELKFALEKYWHKEINIESLRETAQKVRKENWKIQQSHGLDFIPSGDFSLYDHVLDHAIMFNVVPERFNTLSHLNPEDLLFSMARGKQTADGKTIAAMEMTKWFNTNYHYIVPEIDPATKISLNLSKLDDEIKEARSLGIETRPVIIGPISFLLLSKSSHDGFSPLSILSELLPVYQELLVKLHQDEVKWVQLDEPFISTDLSHSIKNAYIQCFDALGKGFERPEIMLTAFFADLSLNMDVVQQSPFEGLHIDLMQTKNVEELIQSCTNVTNFSLGIVNGRNIWRPDTYKDLETIRKIIKLADPRSVIISPSCSMLHLPLDVQMEAKLDSDLKSWFAFAEQKLEILSGLKKALLGDTAAQAIIERNQDAIKNRKNSKLVHLLGKKSKKGKQTEKLLSRKSPYPQRKKAQRESLKLQILPTTTIGSFPQTKEVRRNRSKFNRGEIAKEDYTSFIKKEIIGAIRFQEKIGLDVLVHGEFERNDMVQYFAEKLSGFVFTKFGWVQSFGSRYVRPPIIFGDVTRPEPMTVEWTEFAQSLTKKPIKGMLTGPVTILQWSYIRDDQPRSETCEQIAFAIRDEVKDLERAGTKIIQIDEPALREGLPIQRNQWDDYLKWAVDCFRIASSGVDDTTQIHTHMCYAEFNDIIDAIIAMDADVISIEASRSKMELLNAFGEVTYPNEIGPGIYDIHSPNIPIAHDLVTLIQKALEVIPMEQLWINPDCGLKTRRWEEVKPALKNIVDAAREIRKIYIEN